MFLLYEVTPFTAHFSPTISLKRRGEKKKENRAAPFPRERAIATSYREEKLEPPPEIIAIFSIGRHVNAGVRAAGN